MAKNYLKLITKISQIKGITKNLIYPQLYDDIAVRIGGGLGTGCVVIRAENAVNLFMYVFNPDTTDQILLLTYYDRIFEEGIIVKYPFKIREGRVYRPGIFDMKGS